MSKTYKARVTFAKSILNILGGPQEYKLEQLTPRDYLTARDACHLWLCLLRDKCVSRLEEGVVLDRILGIQGRVLQIGKMLPKIDLYTLLAVLDSGSQYLLDTTTGEKPMSFECFKQHLLDGCQEQVQAQNFFRIMLGLLRDICTGYFVYSDEKAFQDLRAVFCFLGRLSLKDVQSLKDTARDAWYAAELERSWDQDYSGPEEAIIRDWFPIEDTALIANYYSPKHGAGQTAEGINNLWLKIQRNNLPKLVEDIQTCLEWPYQNNPKSKLMASPFVWAYRKPTIEDTEKDMYHEHVVTYVPKNWKTYRSISMEEVGLMFAQQGAMQAIFSYLKNGHTSFAKHYCVNTEDRNRKLAQIGSQNGEYATLDLSQASDSVPLRLVRDWFSHSCLGHLVELRSKYAVANNAANMNDVLEVQKYAPMGSALCFPIECIVFGAVVEACVQKHYGRRHNILWLVYGDDIVCPTPVAQMIIDRLTELGFKVNVSKSYFNTRTDGRSLNIFRESCGGEYLNGIDVTPCRIPRKFEGLYYEAREEDFASFRDEVGEVKFFYFIENGFSRLPSGQEKKVRSIAKLVQLANDLYDHSPTARWAIVNRLLNELSLPIYTDTTGERGLRTKSPTNYHLRRYIDCTTQQVVFSCLQLRNQRKSYDLFEDLDYWDFIRNLSKKGSCPIRFVDPVNNQVIKQDVYNGWVQSIIENRYQWCMYGLGPVLLYEYLRLANVRKDRQPLLWPEQAIQQDIDPRSYVMSVKQVLLPADTDSRVITNPDDWSYCNWNSDAMWSEHEAKQ